jgi:hypothetical protein
MFETFHLGFFSSRRVDVECVRDCLDAVVWNFNDDSFFWRWGFFDDGQC